MPKDIDNSIISEAQELINEFVDLCDNNVLSM